MKEPRIFLTAKWHDLILVTYDTAPEFLLPFIPRGLVPDTINNRAFISLVAFDFLDTKIKGMKIPFHVNFPEINLRIYVKNDTKRGVVFIREFVPKAIIPLIANYIYNENYKAVKMKSSVKKSDEVILKHIIEVNKIRYEINAEAENAPYLPPENSAEHFFKEHEWGFGVNKEGKPLIYKVEHPFWQVYPVKQFNSDIDYGAVYGEKWKFLNDKEPYNVTFAQGSDIKVFEGQLI